MVLIRQQQRWDNKDKTAQNKADIDFSVVGGFHIIKGESTLSEDPGEGGGSFP